MRRIIERCREEVKGLSELLLVFASIRRPLFSPLPSFHLFVLNVSAYRLHGLSSLRYDW